MKITRFEEFIEKAVPYFIAVILLTILLIMQGCATYPNQSKVIEPKHNVKADHR